MYQGIRPYVTTDVIRLYSDTRGVIFDQLEALPPQKAIAKLALLFARAPMKRLARF